MSSQGMNYSFLAARQRRQIKSPFNPLDKCTVVSIYPKQINHNNITIDPGVFVVPPGTYENPSVLVVGTSCWWKDTFHDAMLLEVPVSAPMVAESIIKDYCNGLLAYKANTSMPGLFMVLGEHDSKSVSTNCRLQLEHAKEVQNAWFGELVHMADVDWARTNGNPLAISEDARMAATLLNLKEKAWMGDFKMMEFVPCPACGTPRNPNFPVCGTCKFIDRKLAKELGLEFATA